MATGMRGTFNHNGWVARPCGSVTLEEASCVQVRLQDRQHCTSMHVVHSIIYTQRRD